MKMNLTIFFQMGICIDYSSLDFCLSYGFGLNETKKWDPHLSSVALHYRSVPYKMKADIQHFKYLHCKTLWISALGSPAWRRGEI